MTMKDEGSISSLGHDLSFYTSHKWSDFSSLRSCAAKVASSYETQEDDHNNVVARRVYNEIACLYAREDYVSWQQAWGGLFVSALRKIAIRCMCLGLYVLYREASSSGTESVLVSDICESLGVTFYSELSGSQLYGYPMQAMTEGKKRQVAETCVICFERAIDVLKNAIGDDQNRTPWDLYFMVGKVSLPTKHCMALLSLLLNHFPGIPTMISVPGENCEHVPARALYSPRGGMRPTI